MSSTTTPNHETVVSTLTTRKEEITARLTELAVPPNPTKSGRGAQKRGRASPTKNQPNHVRQTTTTATPPPATAIVLSTTPKPDLHWDFLLKEMQWLAADFHTERKRHTHTRRKVSTSVATWSAGTASRRRKALTDAVGQRRKRAARLGRDVLKAWQQIDRVVTYRQKRVYEASLQGQMNQQLVRLVQQTERYTRQAANNGDGGGGGSSAPTSTTTVSGNPIETALSARVRTTKHRVRDYARLDVSDTVLYGESTEESGSDGSFGDEIIVTGGSSSDDESTLRAAEQEETVERNLSSFCVDPAELELLQEESGMDINVVLKRLQQTADSDGTDGVVQEGTTSSETMHSERANADIDDVIVGEDAVDDAIAGEVHNAAKLEMDEEFEPEHVVDDETTMEAEEQLGRDMTPQEEIDLLDREAQMSVEQLRAMYDGKMNEHSESERAPSDSANRMQVDVTIADKKEKAGSLLEQLDDSTGGDGDGDENEEYDPTQHEAVVDDETTMEAEERLGKEMSAEEEIAMLNRESEMSVEELRAMYAGALAPDESESGSIGSDSQIMDETSHCETAALPDLLDSVEEQENDEEFSPVEQVDDETTMAAEEKLGREMSAEDEIALLKRESTMSVEQLRRMYSVDNKGMQEETSDSPDQLEDDDTLNTSTKRKRRSRSSSSSKSHTHKKKPRDSKLGDTADNAGSANEMAALMTTAQVSRPFLIPNWVKLRKYQQSGLSWLVSLQSRRLNGILADEMGLGKTLQTIALLGYLAAYKGIWGPHLIVVPTSVILNWETELKRFCPALKVLCYYGSAKRRKELRTGWTKSNWYHVVITSYQLAVQDAFAFKRKRWYYLILDEAQHIKNFQSQRWQTLINFNTQRRLLLTGTPLQNNLMELWSLLHFLMPYIFRSRKEFSYWFANPMNTMIEGGESSNKNEDVVYRLHGIIRPFVLRRLKKDVETQMPGKFEHIVKCQLSRRQMFIYEEFMARSSTRQALKKGGNFMGMMNVLMQLRKVCNHPDLFEPRSVVTPFVVEQVVYPMACCVLDVSTSSPIFSQVSDSLICPIWSGSQGLPCLESALRHDIVESTMLLSLEAKLLPHEDNVLDKEEEEDMSVCSLVRELDAEVKEAEYLKKVENVEFQNHLNSRRCRSRRFAYPHSLTRLVMLEKPPLERESCDFLSSPSQLLAMRKSQKERAEDVSDLIKRFVFAVPKAGARPPMLDTTVRQIGLCNEADLEEVFLPPLQHYLEPFRAAQTRLSTFFPDKKLIQFDAGKLQTLASLLRERKRGGHKVLIFTQMSKMLDILEAFLNLNGHTYLRLDGSTNVDRRQRLMDRFNSDPKIFCFILSTRSGGVGINLTGADTVVFYDSDWNPAQDAQAQDRAHRIGQTREVHIYRLITDHTIEQNILNKAKQKRNLDLLVMDKGNFNASQHPSRNKQGNSSGADEVKDVYTKGGLRAILGVIEDDPLGKENSGIEEETTQPEYDAVEVEKTMASLEDDDDVHALRGAQKEAAEELKEFDETIEYEKDQDPEGTADEAKASGNEKGKSEGSQEKDEEKELVKEFAAWQDNAGMDASAIADSLSPVEQYCLRFHEEVDPYYSIFAVLEYRRKIEEEADKEEEIDIDEIDRKKAAEEIRAFEDGDLLCTDPRPEDLIRQQNLYIREKARLNGKKKRRKLNGENWELREESGAESTYWYNIDTGEAIWDKPKVLLEMEAYEVAYKERWSAMPLKPLIHVMSYLCPYPDRMNAAQVCSNWHTASTDSSFVRHVYPVEMGAYTREEKKMHYNHYRTIEDATSSALPGDIIELADGHYWQNSDLVVAVPLKFVGDEYNPSNVTVEMSGSLLWGAHGGFCEGITFRRPKLTSADLCSAELLNVGSLGRVDLVQCAFDNEGSTGNVISVDGPGYKGKWDCIVVKHGASGIVAREGAVLNILNSFVVSNSKSGIECEATSDIKASGCTMEKNGAETSVVKMEDISDVNAISTKEAITTVVPTGAKPDG